VIIGSRDRETAQIINDEVIWQTFGRSGGQGDGVATFHNAEWSGTMTVMIGNLPMCTSVRGGSFGRIVVKVTASALPRLYGRGACATLSSGRDILYTALRARVRG
jgi:hypothetical protein